MRSLTARIFLALVLVNGAVMVAISEIYASALERRQEQRLELLEDAAELRGDDAVRALRRGDRPSADARLDELAPLGARCALLDDGQVAASARDVPREAIDLALAEPTGARRRIGDTMFFASPVRGGRLAGVSIACVAREPEDRWGALGVAPQTTRLVAIVVVSALLSLALARVLSRPIRVLRGGATRLAEGDLSTRVAPAIGRTADSEVEALAADFDRMAERISTLLESRERLLRDVSHELRSPLARLQVALGIARQRAGDGAQPLLDRIEREADRLGELVGLILTMARLDRAGEPGRTAPVRLDELIAEVAADAQFEAESVNKRVTLRASESIVVQGNAEILRQAIENVLRNAVRFTAEDSAVEVTLERASEAGSNVARIEVRDRGPGVPDEALREIWKPFTRLEAARDRGSGGAGIGLAITERAVRLHGGSVVARNAEGGGLAVELRLPAI